MSSPIINDNLFKRCNVSEDVFKRYTEKTASNGSAVISTKIPTIRKVSVNTSTSNSSNSGVTSDPSPTSKTAALEELLLSVPLTEDVASFSDDLESTSKDETIYSDSCNVSVCLPSSGYKSSSESNRYQIRTSRSSSNLLQKNKSDNSNITVRRAHSLKSTSVTDRVSEIRKKLFKSSVKAETDTLQHAKLSANAITLRRSNLKSNSFTSFDSLKQEQQNSSQTDPRRQLFKKVAQNKIGVGNSEGKNRFSVLQRAWEQGKSDSEADLEENQPNQKGVHLKSFSDNEDDLGYRQRREHRRLKREAFLKASFYDKSDSETETEEVHLMQAGLERLERRSKLATLRDRRGRFETLNSHEESNEASSDKTLDSGVFDLALTNLSEDIHRLSKRYDSKEFLLDGCDCLSMKSGYSSASESLADSIADSVTTTCDSNEEHDQPLKISKQKSLNITNMSRYVVSNSSTQFKIKKNNIRSQETSPIVSSSQSNSNPSQRIPIKKKHSATSYKQFSYSPAVLPSEEVKRNFGVSKVADQFERKSFGKHLLHTSTHESNESDATGDHIATKKEISNELLDTSRNAEGIQSCFGKKLLKTNSQLNIKKANRLPTNPTVNSNNENSQNSDINITYDRDKEKKIISTPTKERASSTQQTFENQPGYSPANTPSKETRSDRNDKITNESSLISSSKAAIQNVASERVGDYILNHHNSRREENTENKKLWNSNLNNKKIKTIQKTNSTDLVEKEKASKLQLSDPIEKNPFVTYSVDRAVQCDFLTVDCLEGAPQKLDKNESNSHDTESLQIIGDELLGEIKLRYPDTTTPQEPNFKIVKVDDATIEFDQLRMDNARLQTLLCEVDRARGGTIKALLHVNELLGKVQQDNCELKSDIDVCCREKLILQNNMKEVMKTENMNSTTGTTVITGEKWRKEKIELVRRLDKSSSRAEEADIALIRLKAQYSKVKGQLEHANSAFTTTLQNNLEATKRMEQELKSSMAEKEELLLKCKEINKLKIEVESSKREIEEMIFTQEELQDEKESLEEKIMHLEKKKKQMMLEEEELHEQVAHSQEIIENLSESEEFYKNSLMKEVKEKEYLQECLDETGQILYQLKINERKLLEDKHVLQSKFQLESEEKVSLQTTLSKTLSEHEELIQRLQNMTNIHLTVKESLQLANKKEKNYQEQIESLTTTNHILHYTLEKEKEEHQDLQEMLDIIDMDSRRLKDTLVAKERMHEQQLEELLIEKEKQVALNKELKGKCEELQGKLVKEDEAKKELQKKLTNLDYMKTDLEEDINRMRMRIIYLENRMDDLLTEKEAREINLKQEKEKMLVVMKNLEDLQSTLQKMELELVEVKKKYEDYRVRYNELESEHKECKKRIRDLETSVKDLGGDRDKCHNRMKYYESETKELRIKVNDQTDEIGALQIGTTRLTRERDKLKRSYDTTLHDLEEHRVKCADILKRLKGEVMDLSKRVSEKGNLTSKHKEKLYDTRFDLEAFRNLLEKEVRLLQSTSISSVVTSTSQNHAEIIQEKVNFEILRDSHYQFRNEFRSHVEVLENLLEESETPVDAIMVVQSPMSRIKLEELKLLRSETFNLQSEINNVNKTLAALDGNYDGLKPGSLIERDSSRNQSDDLGLEKRLASLSELMASIERRHQAVIEKNATLLETTLMDTDNNSKDLVKQFQVISLQSENRQLRKFVRLLKKKYRFTGDDVKDELKMLSDVEKTSLDELCLQTNQISDDEVYSSPSISLRETYNDTTGVSLNKNISDAKSLRSSRIKNYHFPNETVSKTSSTIRRSHSFNTRNYLRTSPLTSPLITRRTSPASTPTTYRSLTSIPLAYYSDDESSSRLRPRLSIRATSIPRTWRRKAKSSYP